MSKRKESPLWMPLYVSQYLADTAHMTATQCGAYVNLLCAMWRSEDGTLPNDPDVLAGVSRVHPPRFARVWKGIRSLFDIDRDRVTSASLQAELGKANAKIVMKRAAASLGGQTTQFKTMMKRGSLPAMKESITAPKPLKTNDGAQASAQASAQHNYNRDIEREKEEGSGSPRPGTGEPSLEKEEKGFQGEPTFTPCKPPTTSPPEKPDPRLAALENWGAAQYERRKR